MNATLTHLDLIPHLHPELIGVLTGTGLLIWGLKQKKKTARGGGKAKGGGKAQDRGTAQGGAGA